MAVIPTDWRARINDLDVRDAQGNVLLWELLAGSDDVVAMDILAQLDADEVITNPVAKLWQLYNLAETADVDKTTQCLVGDPEAHGTEIWQRVNSLDAGRVYRLKVLHGEDGNRRGAAMFIFCPE